MEKGEEAVQGTRVPLCRGMGEHGELEEPQETHHNTGYNIQESVELGSGWKPHQAAWRK